MSIQLTLSQVVSIQLTLAQVCIRNQTGECKLYKNAVTWPSRERDTALRTDPGDTRQVRARPPRPARISPLSRADLKAADALTRSLISTPSASRSPTYFRVPRHSLKMLRGSLALTGYRPMYRPFNEQPSPPLHSHHVRSTLAPPLGSWGVGAALRVGLRPPPPRRSAVWRGGAPAPPLGPLGPFCSREGRCSSGFVCEFSVLNRL